MEREQLKVLLRRFRSGEVAEDAIIDDLLTGGIENVGFARIDHQRNERCGFPEVVFGLGKTVEQMVTIFSRLAEKHANILATRVSPEAGAAITAAVPDATHHEVAGCVTLERERKVVGRGRIAVVTAGTTDIPVAEEAALTAEVMGNDVDRYFDVGVAGIHRFWGVVDDVRKAKVVIVAAGMEGALPSVVGGQVAVPVIAVPTSVGYGANFGGIAALLGMLNSCASGVTVVNIDNGFGAGFAAALMNRDP